MKLIKVFLFLLFGIAFSCTSQIINNDIVMINIGDLDREEYANVINLINSYDPKVIAIDLQFSDDTEPHKDWLLLLALEKCKNLVMISVIDDFTGGDIEYKRFTRGSLPEYLIGAKTGFGNTILENDKFQSLKRFSLQEIVNGEIEYHFSVRTVMAFDSLKAVCFVNRNPKIIDIDFKNGRRRFKTFSPQDVILKKISKNDINGKIVMIGFLGPGNIDKFFTPLNKMTKPYKPDMYGLEYLAHIVAQILEYKE